MVCYWFNNEPSYPFVDALNPESFDGSLRRWRKHTEKKNWHHGVQLLQARVSGDLGELPSIIAERYAELCMRYYTLDRANALLVLHWGSNKVVVRGNATIEHDERLFPKRGPSLTRCPVFILLLEYPSVCLPIWLH